MNGLFILHPDPDKIGTVSYGLTIHLCKRCVAIDYTLVGGRSVARVSEATGSRFHPICLLPNLQKLVVYWLLVADS